MNIIKKLLLLRKIEKSYKRAKQIMAANTETALNLEKAILNLKADLEVLAALLPSLKSICKDIKELVKEKDD